MDKHMDFGTKQFLRNLIQRGVVRKDDPNITDTPGRVSRWADSFFMSQKDMAKHIAEILQARFPSKADEMVVVTGVTVYTICPHHLLPVEMKVSIGYLPQGYVIGLSKLARIAKTYARRPVIQEDYTQQVSRAVEAGLSPDAGVYVIGKHYCMVMRGVEEPESKTVTCALLGKFKNEAPRAEFLSLMNHSHNV